MKRFIIERDVPGIGAMNGAELCGVAKIWNNAFDLLAPTIQWEHSYVAGEKTFCIYLAEDEAAIRKHAELSGFPANKITPVNTIIDPTTAN